MRYEYILVGEDAGLAIVTMNRPERRNALSEAHMTELIRALRTIGDAGEARAVVLAAAGPVFSSGHDFADMVQRDLDGMRRLLATCTVASARQGARKVNFAIQLLREAAELLE